MVEPIKTGAKVLFSRVILGMRVYVIKHIFESEGGVDVYVVVNERIETMKKIRNGHFVMFRKGEKLQRAGREAVERSMVFENANSIMKCIYILCIYIV